MAVKTKAYLAHLKPHVAEGLARLAKARNVSQNSLVNEALDAFVRQQEREAIRVQIAKEVTEIKDEARELAQEFSHLDGEGLADETW